MEVNNEEDKEYMRTFEKYGKNNNNFGTPNIFNNSGKRVETENLIGSLSLPLNWNFHKNFTVVSQVHSSLLPN